LQRGPVVFIWGGAQERQSIPADLAIFAKKHAKALEILIFGKPKDLSVALLRLSQSPYSFKIAPSLTTLEKSPFAVPTEPRPPHQKTGRAPTMKSAISKSS
jgi:hypothetical protein